MFDKLREKWRKKREFDAKWKALIEAVSSGYPAAAKNALNALGADRLAAESQGHVMKAAIDRQDSAIFRQVLDWVSTPNVTIKYSTYDGNTTTHYSYAPLTYALEKARTHDISLLLANDPRTVVTGRDLDAAKSGGMKDVAAVLARRIAEQRRIEAGELEREAAKVDGGAVYDPKSSAPAGSEEESALAPGENWALMSKTSVAHVTTSEAIGRKLTEIFNFHSRERVIITENLVTGAETIGTAEPFDRISPETVQRAQKMLTQLSSATEKKSFSL